MRPLTLKFPDISWVNSWKMYSNSSCVTHWRWSLPTIMQSYCQTSRQSKSNKQNNVLLLFFRNKMLLQVFSIFPVNWSIFFLFFHKKKKKFRVVWVAAVKASVACQVRDATLRSLVTIRRREIIFYPPSFETVKVQFHIKQTSYDIPVDFLFFRNIFSQI